MKMDIQDIKNKEEQLKNNTFFGFIYSNQKRIAINKNTKDVLFILVITPNNDIIYMDGYSMENLIGIYDVSELLIFNNLKEAADWQQS